MEKRVLVICVVGLCLQCFALGFMLYGVNHNQTYNWIGGSIGILGLIIIAVGLIILATKKK